MQREELKLTRAELKGQKEEMRVQNETLRVQKFENTFFQLLRMLGETSGAIDLQVRSGTFKNSTTTIITGKDCFAKFFSFYEDKVQLFGKQQPPIDFRASYLEFFETHQSDLGHYFRSLYHIFKLVDQTDNIDQRLYTSLVRAQLSTYELALLFYNCLSELGVEKFKPLIEKYALLKNLPDDVLLEKSHRELYNKNAF
ncbi:MAG: hypothetical protein GQ535_16200 [Rhodobacteraceae bacterium]|nr:hypothetical protein [Paracoccaceae bacterium]